MFWQNLFRPDINVLADWAFKANYLSWRQKPIIYLFVIFTFAGGSTKQAVRNLTVKTFGLNKRFQANVILFHLFQSDVVHTSVGILPTRLWLHVALSHRRSLCYAKIYLQIINIVNGKHFLWDSSLSWVCFLSSKPRMHATDSDFISGNKQV